tara:strand:+ start:5483 stop:6103 length:621 start_codon:yes stop_codon:yes gene_type:complete
MKRFIYLLVLLITFSSCEDDCTQEAVISSVSSSRTTTSKAIQGNNLELKADLVVDSYNDTASWDNVDLNGYTLTVNNGVFIISGNLEGEGTLICDQGGKIDGNVEDATLISLSSISIDGNVEESWVESKAGGVYILGNVEDSTVYFCTDHFILGNTEDSTVEQHCYTLSSGGVLYSDGEIIEVSCDIELPYITVDDNGKSWWVRSN